MTFQIRMMSARTLRQPGRSGAASVLSSSLRPVGRAGERGFAMLVVMLMASAIAFSLYLQVPRYAFESMREREQLLMDRGNQYKRAIQIYYAVNKHYPARLEDLENTNDKRFLRRRYKDPLTGKDEWRLIHTNGTALTDSLVQKPPAQNAANGAPGVGVLPGGGPLGTNNMNAAPDQATSGQNNVTGQPNNGQPQPVPVNTAVLRRPSDRLGGLLPASVPNSTPNPLQDNGLVPGLYPPGYNPSAYNPNDPSTWPPITLAPTTQGQPGQLQPGQQPGQQAGQFPNQVPNGQPNGQPTPGLPVSIPGFGGGQSGQPGLAGQQPTTQISSPFGDQTQGVVPTPFPFGSQPVPGSDPFNSANQPTPVPAAAQGQTGIPGQGPGLGGQNPQNYNPGLGFQGNPFAPDSSSQQQQPGFPQPGVAQTGAQPGVAPTQLNPALQTINAQLSTPSGQTATPFGNNQQPNSPQMAPGIAGVASKYEGPSIKTYNKRTKYKEWEFVFDPATASTGVQAANGQPALNGQGQNGQANGQQSPQGTNGSMFSLPGFGPAPGQSPQSGPQPVQTNGAPAQNPFGQPSNPFGAPTQ